PAVCWLTCLGYNGESWCTTQCVRRGGDVKQYGTAQLRNVALVSHAGAGKTMLAEAMLFDSGAITRLGRVEDGSTTSDFDPDEIRHKISVSNAVLPIEWRDCKINLIDTPGYADFVGDIKG